MPDLKAENLATWQVDTNEIDDVVRFYSLHLGGAPDQAASRLGLIMKKLAGVPRLAQLVVAYAEMQRQQFLANERKRGSNEIRFVERIRSALGRAPSAPNNAENDSMYDPWIDG